MRFPKSSRLLSAPQFKNVFGQGRRLQNRQFVVIAANNSLDHPRLGLAISKRRAKRALDRNRIKRVIRESFRQHAATLPCVDIIVLAQHATVSTDNRQLFAGLAQHWHTLMQESQGISNHG